MRYNANEKSLARYLIDLTELKIRYLELSVRAFEAKNKLFKDEMDRLFKNRMLELEDNEKLYRNLLASEKENLKLKKKLQKLNTDY